MSGIQRFLTRRDRRRHDKDEVTLTVPSNSHRPTDLCEHLEEHIANIIHSTEPTFPFIAKDKRIF